MWRYFKAAFLVGVEVPLLGRVPLNAMAAAGLAILGFAEPSIWLAGMGVEAAIVGALAFNPRFQRVVDARGSSHALEDAAAKRQALIAALPANLNQRLANLRKSSVRILSIYGTLGVDPDLISGNRASLDKLEWIYLKLLIARNHLETELGAEPESALRERIRKLESATGPTTESTVLQRSRQATLAILQRRAENLKNRDRMLQENESDLGRIEAQVELMRENAAIEGKPSSVDTEIELASDLAAPDLYGMHSSLVHDLEASAKN